MCSDLDEIWLKNQACYEDVVAQIWGQFDLFFIFPFFDHFQLLLVLLVGNTCVVQVKKYMVVFFTFLSLCRSILRPF